MIFDYTDIQQLVPNIIRGSVTSRQSNLPVSGAHVYIRPGKEEAITASNGNYSLSTWQPLPALLTVEHRQYEPLTIKITDTAGQPTIQLQQKL